MKEKKRVEAFATVFVCDDKEEKNRSMKKQNLSSILRKVYL